MSVQRRGRKETDAVSINEGGGIASKVFQGSLNTGVCVVGEYRDRNHGAGKRGYSLRNFPSTWGKGLQKGYIVAKNWLFVWFPLFQSKDYEKWNLLLLMAQEWWRHDSHEGNESARAYHCWTWSKICKHLPVFVLYMIGTYLLIFTPHIPRSW